MTPPHRRRIVLPGVLIGGMLVTILASLFVIPLGNSQHTSTIAQDISNLFSNSQSNAFGTSQQAITPTVNVISSGDSSGSCRGTDIWSTCATYITASGIQGTGQMQRPIQGAVISQVFGHPEYQLWCGCWRPHTGIDLAAPYGTPITAADRGQVTWVGWDWSGLGWAVKINHGNYIATIYGHMDHFIVKVGQNVTKGQIVGYEGSTGASTGPHVHFMVLLHNVWVDPQLYMQLP
jgi:murein DD-endopeptidase MepM/ murein hydrolase activator NlpD